MASITTFSAYLNSLSHDFSLSNSTSLQLDSSPHKRPRSDSPDTSSSQSFILYESSSTLSPATSSCAQLRSILTPTSQQSTNPSSPLSSPPISRPVSRRSSTSTSTTSKSVRFARCTNASVFPCLSGDDYDRSSIIPTREEESLELPRRKRSEAEGWIKCVERERVLAAKKEGVEIMKGTKEGVNGRCEPFDGFLPVEGKTGLIEGGYFVGEEGTEWAMEGVEDGLTTDEEFNKTEEDDCVGAGLPTPTSTKPPPIILSKEKKKYLAEGELSVSPKALGFLLERSKAIFDDDEEDEEEDAESGEERDDEDNGDLDQEEEDVEEADRYGLVGLGKFSRSEVFSNHDSFGGF